MSDDGQSKNLVPGATAVYSLEDMTDLFGPGYEPSNADVSHAVRSRGAFGLAAGAESPSPSSAPRVASSVAKVHHDVYELGDPK